MDDKSSQTDIYKENTFTTTITNDLCTGPHATVWASQIFSLIAPWLQTRDVQNDKAFSN